MNNPFVADVAVTRALMERLVKAFEDFADEMAQKDEAGLRYVDALMGCHNFYKAVVMDLEQRSGDDRNFYRNMAIDTLVLGLGIPISREER